MQYQQSITTTARILELFSQQCIAERAHKRRVKAVWHAIGFSLLIAASLWSYGFVVASIMAVIRFS